MIKQSNAAEFKKLHMSEIELYIKFFKDKVKDNESFSEEEIEEAVNVIRDKLTKIMELDR